MYVLRLLVYNISRNRFLQYKAWANIFSLKTLLIINMKHTKKTVSCIVCCHCVFMVNSSSHQLNGLDSRGLGSQQKSLTFAPPVFNCQCFTGACWGGVGVPPKTTGCPCGQHAAAPGQLVSAQGCDLLGQFMLTHTGQGMHWSAISIALATKDCVVHWSHLLLVC